MPELTESVTVTRNDADGRYEIHVGDALGGYTEFHADAQARLVFPHTQIDPAFAGRGLGGALIGAAMNDLVARGETIVPRCPFVVRYLQKNEVEGLTIAWPAASRHEAPAGGAGV